MDNVSAQVKLVQLEALTQEYHKAKSSETWKCLSRKKLTAFRPFHVMIFYIKRNLGEFSDDTNMQLNVCVIK